MARILCVDDDSTANLTKRNVLQRAGHSVDICKSADDAVFRLRATAYDALITDWRLAEGSARGIIQAARLQSETLVIVVSGSLRRLSRLPVLPLISILTSLSIQPNW